MREKAVKIKLTSLGTSFAKYSGKNLIVMPLASPEIRSEAMMMCLQCVQQ